MDNAVTRNGQRWSNAATDIVGLVEPDAHWPAMFTAEVEAIRAVLGGLADDLRFEHVGSTAVPGLSAEPIIDLLIVPTDGGWPKDAFVDRLPSVGYVFWAGNPDPWHLFFVKGMPPFGTGRTHHVHVRPPDRAAPVVAFRDHLRSHPEVAAEYAGLKRQLAATYPSHRESYTRGKEAFVAGVLQRAARLGS